MPPNDAFVIHCFAPLMCQPSSVRSAARQHRPGVGARPRLGQREAADALAACERRHEARALLLRPELQDRQRARRGVDGDRHADARVRARELLEHQDVREEVRAGAAVLLRHADAHQAELAQLRQQRARKRVCTIPFGGVRLDLRGREIAGERLDLPLLRRELEVHGGQTTGVRWTAIILIALAADGCGGRQEASPPSMWRAPGAPP